MIKKHGHAFISVSVSLLNPIYKFEGYYADYDEDLIFAIADSLYMEEEEVEKVIRSCIEAGLFDKEKFAEHSILTSREIQENYLFAVKRRKDTRINDSFMITSCAHPVDKNGHSKGKEKIVKENEGGEEDMLINRGADMPIQSIGISAHQHIDTSPPPPSWKNDFKIYIRELTAAYREIMTDEVYFKRKRLFYPDIDIGRHISVAGDLDTYSLRYYSSSNNSKIVTAALVTGLPGPKIAATPALYK